MIYIDKMPPGYQITLNRPQAGGLEPKCRYWQAANFSGLSLEQTQHLQHIVEVRLRHVIF